MPDAAPGGRLRDRNPVAVALGIAAAVFPLLAVVFLVARELAREAEPDTLAGWVARLESTDPERRDRAEEVLLERAGREPAPVIAALVEGLRRQAAEAPEPAGDVAMRLVAADGEGLEAPPLPIGIWIFGERTLVGDGERLDLKVVPVEAWRSFCAAHAGRTLAFTADGEVVALHRITGGEGETLALRPSAGRPALDRVFVHHRFFHDGYTEAGKVLASLGSGVRPALTALAAEGPAAAHVASWAWWRLDHNEAEAAEGR